MSGPLSPAWRRLFRAPVYLYRWRLGPLLGRRFLLLIHVGRRTGKRRETVLEVVEYRDAGPEAVVMSAWGRNADWLRNIEATPAAAEVVVGSVRFAATHRILASDEASRVVAGYEQRNRFIAPVVRFAFGRFAGWPYRGGESDRHRLVTQLPLVAFRPRA
jgi:deazaflavin-dependent oxidoreductase (nitroreductase family)